MVRRGTQAAGGFLSGFGDFIMRGNVVDLAVAVIIGAAFSKIIDSLVADIITPAILNPAMKAAGVDKLADLSAGGIQYGLFLAAILNFLVIALCIYAIVQAFEKAKKRLIRQEALAEETPDAVVVAQERLTTSIERLTEVMETKQM
ncbi:large conductance mechanosensitive channel protein MscL [Waterburya agarophytonicola K14]|uniref:Large-conductance mechanosensitive channel n=1 Tax=Waterburya agarophytonicola KI4 TaxID=2874699 RepID=A0A964FIY4_9CYAN|nr:large conductance mechanosensitive channel protein MscL [Waterburya agarophytonicola]MCC0178799.1 large conductance mechanosensitive channel protein MscL [Waterburya agarophytonicola KI4]